MQRPGKRRNPPVRQRHLGSCFGLNGVAATPVEEASSGRRHSLLYHQSLDSRGWDMKSLVWLTVGVLGMTACGQATTATTTATPPAATTPATTTAATSPQVAGTDLSGLGFEVHQEPG